MSSDNAIEFDKWSIYVDDKQKLITIRIHENMNIEEHEILDMVREQKSRCNNVANYSRIIIAGQHSNISPDARNTLQEVELPVKKEAYVIQGLAQKLIVNFYIKFRPNKHPFRAFNKEKDALEWLGINI